MAPMARAASFWRASRALQTPLSMQSRHIGSVSRPAAQLPVPAARRHASTEHGHDEHAAGDHGHGSHYDPPTGWLWGIAPGKEYEKEGWENLWYYGFYGSLVLTAIALAFKPDTSIETWALEEAKRRLQAEGTLPEDE